MWGLDSIFISFSQRNSNPGSLYEIRLHFDLIWIVHYVVFLCRTIKNMQGDTRYIILSKFLEVWAFFFFFSNHLQSLCISLFTDPGIINIYWVSEWIDLYLSLCIIILFCVWCRSDLQLVCLRHFNFCFKVIISIY